MSDAPKEHDLPEFAWAELRAATPPPSPELMSRIRADADRLQPAPAPGPLGRFLAQADAFFASIGGWQGASALTASALLGIWLGTGDGSPAAEMSAQLLGGVYGDGMELAPDDPFGAFLVEG